MNRLEAGIHWLYKFNGFKPPADIHVFDSPNKCIRHAQQISSKITLTDNAGLCADTGWAVLYDFCLKSRVISNKKALQAAKNYMQLMRAGVWDMIAFENVALISRRPVIWMEQDDPSSITVRFRDNTIMDLSHPMMSAECYGDCRFINMGIIPKEELEEIPKVSGTLLYMTR